MIDDPLPTPSGIDAEAESGDDRPPRESAAAPDRTTDPPPDSGAGEATDEREPEPAASDEDTEESEPLEYRLERLRLWRTVATLAVVVARLVRSL